MKLETGSKFINDIKSTLEILGGFSAFKSLIGAIGLIFLGLYVLKVEKWAVILSGIFGIASLINSKIILGTFGTGLFSGKTGISAVQKGKSSGSG